jgi:formylglycine-generating enzyme required for sulfatase activity
MNNLNENSMIEMIPVQGGKLDEYRISCGQFKTDEEIKKWDMENKESVKEFLEEWEKATTQKRGDPYYAASHSILTFHKKESLKYPDPLLAEFISSNPFIRYSGYDSDFRFHKWNKTILENIFIDKFLMSKYLITQEIWGKVMHTEPSNFKGKNLPVETVTWNEAAEFCNVLSQSEGLTPAYNEMDNQFVLDRSTNGYRLPSLLQYIYALLGGRKTEEYYYGDEKYAWTCGNSFGKKFFGLLKDEDKLSIQPVGKKRPNPLGIFDLWGNVSEWCNDWGWSLQYLNSVKQQKQLSNLTGPDTGTFKMACGACSIYSEYSSGPSFIKDFDYTKLGYHLMNSDYSELLYLPTEYSQHIGFRVVRPL